MHEFSIAMNVVDIATEYANREQAKVVREIEIEVGIFSGVVVDALEFAMESAVKGTILENAICKIAIVQGIARCPECMNEFETDDLFKCCPKCKTCAPYIIQGRELRVKSLIVD
ncbi:MAG: hydrogenase maturation nickel metallochaperone HypA [Bacteroidales bacterium]|nr:hydrogenase maturation nickel metallochaperone HypA [Bacteroidales bacterium]